MFTPHYLRRGPSSFNTHLPPWRSKSGVPTSVSTIPMCLPTADRPNPNTFPARSRFPSWATVTTAMSPSIDRLSWRIMHLFKHLNHKQSSVTLKLRATIDSPFRVVSQAWIHAAQENAPTSLHMSWTVAPHPRLGSAAWMHDWRWYAQSGIIYP